MGVELLELTDGERRDIEDVYDGVSDFLCEYNACHAMRLVSVEFELDGLGVDGNGKCVRGCLVDRERDRWLFPDGTASDRSDDIDGFDGDDPDIHLRRHRLVDRFGFRSLHHS